MGKAKTGMAQRYYPLRVANKHSDKNTITRKMPVRKDEIRAGQNLVAAKANLPAFYQHQIRPKKFDFF